MRSVFIPTADGVQRGVRLFTYLADAANRGDATGVSFGGFIAFLHGRDNFRQVAGRNFLPGDNADVIHIASEVTRAAGGRKSVTRSGHVILAGMDTFIWRAAPPFPRPRAAWRNLRYRIPYTPEEWLLVFPDGARRLIRDVELRRL